MLTDEGPKVVEYNCRLGDPETQVVLPLLESDLVDALLDVVAGRSASTRCVFRKGAAACVVMASEGYPGDYRKGLPILGIEDAGEVDGVLVFHAGTRRSNGRLCTAGGRVLGVTAFGADLPAALETAYEGVSRITFQGNQFRTDIGRRGLARVH
jgi:phosphoribosylamine--glycine ligase